MTPTFNHTTFESYKPQINYIKNFFKKHHITNPSFEECFQTTMTLFYGTLETMKELSNYLYYSFKNRLN